LSDSRTARLTPSFIEMLQARWAKGKFVCVGLDPVYEKLPDHYRSGEYSRDGAIESFCERIVDATSDEVCAFKPNSAFSERLGWRGVRALEHVCAHIRTRAPEVPIILDVKRGDIGTSTEGYAAYAFDQMGAHAATINPYLGQEACQPFLDDPKKGAVVLVRTSNPGASEFQDRPVAAFDEQDVWNPDHLPAEAFPPLYKVVAHQVATKWNGNGNCCVVAGAGATGPDELAEIRKIVGDIPILIPGVGAQGGKIEDVVPVGKDSNGAGFIINLSRSVLYASSDTDFAQAARKEVQRANDEINRVREPIAA
jgi:orotidine-5'-phosphate decarboxylase